MFIVAAAPYCLTLTLTLTLQLHIWRQAANSIAFRDVENFHSVTIIINPTRIIRVKNYPINQKYSYCHFLRGNRSSESLLMRYHGDAGYPIYSYSVHKKTFPLEFAPASLFAEG